VKLKAVIRMLD